MPAEPSRKRTRPRPRRLPLRRLPSLLRTLLAALPTLARRPRLWPTAARQLLRLAPTGWWRRFPFLPLPAADYLGFRLETMYGSPDGPADPADLIRWLSWCREVDAGSGAAR